MRPVNQTPYDKATLRFNPIRAGTLSLKTIPSLHIATLALVTAFAGGLPHALVAAIPQCQSSLSDTDGDGWGWQNNQSCRVKKTGKHAICSSPDSDSNGDGWGYENNQSCMVIPETAAANGPANKGTANTDGIIYKQTFSNADVGLYQGDHLNDQWDTPIWHSGFDQGRVQIVTDLSAGHDKVMQVTYPAGAYGAVAGSAFLTDMQFGMDLPKSYNELYLAYDIKFDSDFDFVRGGKLPGLCGHSVNQAPATGCNTGGGFPSGYDGWSARGMWRSNGSLENYVYHANQTGHYGEQQPWNSKAIPGKWHRVQHRVVLNEPGHKDGILQAWFDRALVLSVDTMEYRKTHSIGINLFYFSTFFGGNDSSWAPATGQRIFFDNFVISTKNTLEND